MQANCPLLGNASVVSLSDALRALPLPANAKWPNGVFDRQILHGREIEVALFAPLGQDFQTPHDRDEIYFIASGSGSIELADEIMGFSAGDMIFVAAGIPHRFVEPLNFAAWVVFFDLDRASDQETSIPKRS